MTIEQSDVIDRIATAPDGTVMLAIIDHLEWEPFEAHRQALLAKLNAYLAFIEEGQILEDYPQARGKSLEVRIICKYRPTEDAVAFLERVAPEIERYGATLAYGPIHGGSCTEDES